MFFADSELSLEFLGVFQLKREQTAWKHSICRNYDSISIRLSGTGFFKTEDTVFTVGPGYLLYIPKDAIYQQSTQGETVIAIHFFNYTYHKENKMEQFPCKNRVQIEDKFQELYRIWKKRETGYRYQCISLLYQILYLLNGESVRPVQSSPFSAAMDYIHTHYRTDTIRISDLASMCTVSETYFRKKFKELYSSPPSQYILRLRLEYATQLLRSQLYTVAEVSEKSGFHDVKYFGRMFRQQFGVTPSHFQKILPETAWK